MLRCAALALAAAFTLPASAQVHRNFPPNALRGELLIVQPPDALLNGQSVRLAPGSRIRGEENLLLMSGALIGQKRVVNYTVDTSGLVRDVWILQPGERAKKPWPVNERQAAAWRFDFDAQTWSKP